MKIYYQSYKRFETKIIRKWDKSGFKYNSGHVQILRFAWISSLYWANLSGQKVSEVNKRNTNPTLF